MTMVKTALSLKWQDIFSWIQVPAWCKDCARYFVVHVLHSIYQWHQAALLSSEHPEVRVSIDSIKLFKTVDKFDPFQKLLDLVLMCMVLAQCVCE